MRPHLSEITLTGFPLPPSANALYRNLKGWGKGRASRCKTGEYKAYEFHARVWANQNAATLAIARQLASTFGPRRFCSLDVMYWMDQSRIITKAMIPKRNDTSNRLKALHDVLFDIIGVDDKWVWSGSFDKSWLEPGRSEGCDITISLIEL